MVTVGLWVRLEAKVGRERELEVFLRSAMPLVDAEAGTLVWFGVRLSSATFGIFDAFADEAGRQAHLTGRVAAALGDHAATLLATPPTIEQLDVLAVKLPK
jgi:quinol monooxygenase YgiN